jgi:hypothetical protein
MLCRRDGNQLVIPWPVTILVLWTATFRAIPVPECRGLFQAELSGTCSSSWTSLLAVSRQPGSGPGECNTAALYLATRSTQALLSVKRTHSLATAQTYHVMTCTFSFGISEILSRKPEVTLLEVLAAEPLPALRSFDHYPEHVFHGLVNDVINCNYTAYDDCTSERGTGQDALGNGHGLISGTVPAYAWRNWRKSQRTLARTEIP